MAKKRISRSRKRALEQPDEFITLWNKMFKIATENKVLFSGALGFIVVSAIVFLGVVYYFKTSEIQSFALLQQAMEKYQAVSENNGPYKAFLEVDENFQSILGKYPNSKGGKLARFLYANICYQADNLDQAVELFNQSLADFQDEPFLKDLVISSLGYVHEGREDYPTAAKFFEMVTKEPGSAMKDEAYFHLGDLYEKMGYHEKSLEAFKKIMADHIDSMYIEIAKEKIRG